MKSLALIPLVLCSFKRLLNPVTAFLASLRMV